MMQGEAQRAVGDLRSVWPVSEAPDGGGAHSPLSRAAAHSCSDLYRASQAPRQPWSI